ncbi:hypothetical protein CBM2614_B40026 [Cupriavidus taiwanensis]|nr:hypothetical protein CBM2614_B40026 [Cupriavidus taiwanensis]
MAQSVCQPFSALPYRPRRSRIWLPQSLAPCGLRAGRGTRRERLRDGVGALRVT